MYIIYMQSFKKKYIFIFILIGSIFLSGSFRLVSQDANDDNRIDLKDAILNAQRIGADGDNSSLKLCTSTMQALSGLIGIYPNAFKAFNSTVSDLYCLLSETNWFYSSTSFKTIFNIEIFFKSIVPSLLYKPPIFS